MKRTKRIVAMMMVVVLMLALSMSAFAAGSVTLYINGVSQGSYSVGNDNTVYDIVSQLSTALWSSEYDADPTYSPLCLSGTLNGYYNGKVVYLTSLNGVGSAPHIPVAGSLDANNNYIANQTVDTALQDANTALAAYGGLGRWIGNGYGLSANGQYMVYIGEDWQFTVNNAKPGASINPPDPWIGSFFEYTMRESLLAGGDRIDLNYTYALYVFAA